jgi:hypothetical protein
MDGGIATILVAMAGGIGFVAIKYPYVFERLFYLFAAVISCALFLSAAWDAAVSVTYTTLIPLVAKEETMAAVEKVDALKLMRWSVLLVFICAAVYLFLLNFVSRVVQRREQELKAESQKGRGEKTP